MKRMILSITAAMLVAAMLAVMAGPALAEGHHCRHWQPDAYYGGYWLWLQCPGEAGRYTNWYPELPWYTAYDGPLQFLEPYTY